MKVRIAAALSAAGLILPAVGGAALPSKKVVVQWKQVLGPKAQADRWGYMQVLLVVRKQTTTVGLTTTVKRKITAVRVPVRPSFGSTHTYYLNKELIPVLAQEVLREQFRTQIDVVSEATDSSLAFDRSLQAALIKGRKV